MRFTKMQGAGNDFVIIDPGEVSETGLEGADLPALARRVCDRHFGIGADGILVPAASEVADLKMVHLNADGSSAEMCGNGLRCLVRYARDFEILDGDALTVETGAGVRKVILFDDGSSRVNMGPPAFEPPVGIGGTHFLRVSMGNPHAVAFLESEAEVDALDLVARGRPVERDHLFPNGTNVEFVAPLGEGGIRMRVWERGAGETLASGSGSCASAVAAIRAGLARSPVRVVLDGGTVEVEWAEGDGNPVYMTGPAEYVCEGEFVAQA